MTPEKLVHQGTVTAVGFLFDPIVHGELEMQRRALALWEPGVRLWQTDEGRLLLLLPRPQTLHTAQAPGLPLTRERGHLLALPLTRDEWEALRPSPESLIFCERGHVSSTALSELSPCDPADGLDLSGTIAVPTRPLIAPEPPKPEPIRAAIAPLKAPTFVTRPPGVNESLITLAKSLNAPPPPDKRRRLQDLPWLEQQWWKLYFAVKKQLQTASDSTAGRLRETIREQVFSPGQLEAISRQNAEFLNKMLELFEKGEWHEALQHAIPLGKPGEQNDAPEHLGFLMPRNELAIRPTPTPASGSLPWQGLHGGFKQLYREAVARLKAEGRYEEAAYVLAELLREDEEAVSFLERHGQLKLAAELAEARNLPPALVVRQWWLAGDKSRALAIARRSQCFADAIFRLEQSGNTAAAETLRVEWAQLHAEWGDYARAVTTIESVTEARALARRWAELGASQGGVGGALLLSRLILWSETDDEKAHWQEQAQTLVSTPGAAREREALLVPLFTRGADTLSLRPLLRRGIRALLADHGAGALALSPPSVGQWCRAAGFGALEADLPSLTLKPLPPLHERLQTEDLRIEGGDVGTVPLADAAILPDGRLLVALGEAGVLLLSHDGRTLHRFEVPATSLVVGTTGSQVVALAHRDESQRVHVLEVGARKVTDWGELSLTCWEPSLSEGLWRVGQGEQILTLDTLAPKPQALRGSTLPQGEVLVALAPGDGVLTLIPNTQTLWLWTETASKRRQQVPFSGGTFDLTNQSVYWLQTDDDEELSLFGEPAPVLYGQLGATQRSSVLGEPGDTPAGLAVVRRGTIEVVAAALRSPLGISVLLSHDTPRGLLAPALNVQLSGTERVRLRLTPSHLVIADSQGRVLAIELEQGRLVRDLRVRL